MINECDVSYSNQIDSMPHFQIKNVKFLCYNFIKFLEIYINILEIWVNIIDGMNV